MSETDAKTERNIRPRVLAAVLRLQRFTAQEIVSTAGLKNSKQAWVQLAKLEKDGFLTSSQSRADEGERVKLYMLVEDRTKQADLVQVAENYGLEGPPHASQSLFREALIAATSALDRTDALVSSMDIAQASLEKLNTLLFQVDELIVGLDDIALDIQTAKAEATGSFAEKELLFLDHRHLAVRQMLIAVKSSILRRHSALIIRRVALKADQVDFALNPHLLRKALVNTESEFANEIVCDLLSPARKRHDLMPLLTSHAMRTYDLDLIRFCLARYQPERQSHWWHYNVLSIDFLLGHFKRVYENIQTAWASVVGKPLRRPRSSSSRIFFYDPEKLTQQALSPLLSRYEISLISPSSLNFWNWTENVICPLLIEPTSEKGGPLTGTVQLKTEQMDSPIWKLFAYGPLSSAIQRWPGAPPLRVACSMRDFLRIDFEIRLVADALRNRRGVIVVQDHQSADPREIHDQVTSALHKCEELSVS